MTRLTPERDASPARSLPITHEAINFSGQSRYHLSLGAQLPTILADSCGNSVADVFKNDFLSRHGTLVFI
jgi:hypothetical protein